MHLVETMAYAGDRPWHGLGNPLAPQQPIEVWKKQAGMDWQIEEAEVRYVTGSNNIGVINAFPEQKVLYRSDNKAPLSVVSKRFQVVQPGEILEFYRDLTACSGFELETAGVLREGRKFWALARTGQSTTLKGRDKVDGYLLLATACDGTLATLRSSPPFAWSATTPWRSHWVTLAAPSRCRIAASSTPRQSSASWASLCPRGMASLRA